MCGILRKIITSIIVSVIIHLHLNVIESFMNWAKKNDIISDIRVYNWLSSLPIASLFLEAKTIYTAL